MVQEMTPTTVRVKFCKTGNLQYISHLDLVRTMNKVVTRAALPLWYTEGFNPKPKMVFAAPLSIGTESVVEFMDLRLTERADPTEIMDALNRNLTEEMQVSEVYYPQTRLTDLKWLRYDITIDTEGAGAELAAKCELLLSKDSVITEKKGKNGEFRLVDIRPLIHTVKATAEKGTLHIFCILSGDASAFLNPELVVRYLKKEAGILSDPCLVKEGYRILRAGAYREDMTPFR